jgi:hypothetical protein
MKWHAESQSDREGGDGLVRHPYDSKAWKHFHKNVDPMFQHDAKNVHFALAADGVNPFKKTRSTWSTWPVVLLNYNLPPWLSTKKFFLMLCLLIPGKQSVTSECFDVYMEPLVEELLELWSSVPVFDITEEEGLRNFTLRVMLIWTIHDFPGYGIVGGFAHQGFAACPWCGEVLGAEHSTELAVRRITSMAKLKIGRCQAGCLWKSKYGMARNTVPGKPLETATAEQGTHRRSTA